ncbi:MAG TPA: HEAT repeat domain-containing protein [Nitrospirota bacterium]|nr:HEAT repeat domain-containing protein [Nitrospirota bacterium]
MKRNVLSTIMALILAAAGSAAGEEINGFEDCAKAGYPILESYPRRCKTPDGRMFTETTPRQNTKTRPCARVNEMCGGIAGILCCSGLTCLYDGNYPDAGGVCKAERPGSRTLDPPKTEKEIKALIKLLDDDNVDVQVSAALDLGKAKAGRAVSALIRKFEKLPELSPGMGRDTAEEAARLGAAFAQALGMIGDPRAVPPLLERREFYFLHGGEAPLAWIGAPALPALLRVANDKKDRRHSETCSIISSIKDPAAVPALMSALQDTANDSCVRVSALSALGKMKTPGIKPFARDLLSTSDPSARLGALYWMVKSDPAAYTPDLLRFLHDRDWYIRTGAARFAGQLKVHEAEARLIELLKDTDDSVRHSAATSLWKLTGKAYRYDKGGTVLSSERTEKGHILSSIKRKEPKSSQEFYLRQAQEGGYLLEYTIDELLAELDPEGVGRH